MRVEWDEDNNVEQMWEQVKQCKVDSCMMLLKLQWRGRKYYELGIKLQKKAV